MQMLQSEVSSSTIVGPFLTLRSPTTIKISASESSAKKAGSQTSQSSSTGIGGMIDFLVRNAVSFASNLLVSDDIDLYISECWLERNHGL